MKLYFSILFTLLIISAGCEDTKKTTDLKDANPQETSVDSLEIVKNDTITDESEFPEITNENIVSFLTEYGKKNPETSVLISTKQGDVEIELYKDTPLHRANFIYLVKQKYFDETYFHRIVPNFIIQGGNADDYAVPKFRSKIGGNYLIPAEINGRKHEYGSVTGAKEYRENPDKKTMPFEFFIFLGPLSSSSHLNGNYTVFGKVSKGMDVVEKIANLPRSEDEWPKQNVNIKASIIQ